MYNFCELITQSVVIQQKQKKYTYKVNFSDAVHVCFEFFRKNVPPPIVEAMLMNYISPIRPAEKILVSKHRNLRLASLIE